MSTNTVQSKLSLSCCCGNFKASVLIEEKVLPSRLKCYCIDCQSYVQHLNQADVQLDSQGGTELLQVSPAQFSITEGQEHLSNLMLSPSGIYRWYAGCCNTPICNTTSKAEMPFTGLITKNIRKITTPNGSMKNHSAIGKKFSQNKTLNDENREEHLSTVFGPVKFGICAGDRHPIKADWPVAKGFGFKGVLRTLRGIGRWRLRGDHKRSVFIDSTNNTPLVQPTLISKEERKAAEVAVKARIYNPQPAESANTTSHTGQH